MQPNSFRNYPNIKKDVLNKNLHPKELPILASLIGVLFLVLIFSITSIIRISQRGLEDTNLKIGYFSFGILGKDLSDFLLQILLSLFVFAPIIIFFYRGILFAQLRSNSVEITMEQYPEQYAFVVQTAQQFGLSQIPRIFVILGNGVINAAASGHMYNRFLFINSDLFEIKEKNRNPEALNFVIAHEIGHIAAGHTSYFRTILLSYAMQIPFLGSVFSRAQEYTADNYGFMMQPTGAPDTIATLTNGKYLQNEVYFPSIVRRAVTESGFFIWIANALSTHPVITWRAFALEFRSHPGKLLFKPKNYPATIPTTQKITNKFFEEAN